MQLTALAPDRVVLSSTACRRHRQPEAPRDAYVGTVEPAVPQSLEFQEALLPAPPARAGFPLSNLDTTTSPREDFYQYAMGGYLASHPIPEDRARYGIDAEVTVRNEAVVREILEELAAGPAGDKLGDFYASGMNLEAIETAGVAPLKEDLARLEAIADRHALQQEIGRLHAEGIGVYFSFYATQDAKDTRVMIGELAQGGLGLPERDYYLAEDQQETREAYRQHVARMLELAGCDPRGADAVLRVETALARASLSRTEMRDPEALYNKKDPAALQALAPGFDFSAYLASQGADPARSVNVSTPAFFEALDGILAEVPLEDQKAYLKWHLISSSAPFLSSDFEGENFAFYGKTMRGLEQQPPRWRRVADQVDASLGEALGVKFVERRFSPEARARVEEMVDTFKAVLKERIENLSWMGDDTRAAALEKLSTFRAKIGYPDNPESYSDLAVDRGLYVDNVRRAHRFHRAQDVARIGLPVDRDRWYMSASTNNAYYDPLSNEIVFPAGILQTPYFDEHFDEAMNYGAIGATVGHELSHGFDDEGAQYDAQGNLRNWFSEDDLARFQARARGIEEQFSEYEVEGLKVDGKLVLGEALADLGGLELAWAAYKRASAGKPSQVLDGFTSDQRFFLSFAQSWATNVRPEFARLMVKTDPHPLPKLRVNGTLSNMPEFFEAFGVQEGDPMRRPEDKRNAIWR